MALILNIDTATEYASLALSKEGNILGFKKNKEVKDHASWIHHAIHELLEKCGHSLSQLQAVAITVGPGSYTGLRVGMATAKGLCYVLDIPLIVENTLKVMASTFVATCNPASANSSGAGLLGRRSFLDGQSFSEGSSEGGKPATRLVPMIDARRMEVYTAIYDDNLVEIMPPVALVLDPGSFDAVKSGNRLICFGSGSQKFESIARPGEFEFERVEYGAGALASLAYQKFRNKQFSDLAYTEPLYLKEFYSPSKK
jgi:tRNA threonylcarbamoyladenosine biosynthesis protein TsaB